MILSIARTATERIAQTQFAWKLRHAFAGQDFSFISSNCLGGRFSRILNRQYRSPTVGLYFFPTDYLNFISDLPAALKGELVQDTNLSTEAGYPVGYIGDCQIRFMHYSDFESAKARWDSRRQRVDFNKTFFIFTDRDGASYEHLKIFDKLPYARKIAFVRQRYPELKHAVFVGGYENSSEVGELYSEWHRLNRALSMNHLRGLAAPQGVAL